MHDEGEPPGGRDDRVSLAAPLGDIAGPAFSHDHFSTRTGMVLFGFFGLAHQARAKISSWQFGKKKKTALKGREVQPTPESTEEARTSPETPATEDGGEKNAEEKVEDSGSSRRIFPGDR